MKKNKQKAMYASLLGFSFLGGAVIALDLSTIKSEAVSTGDMHRKTIVTSKDENDLPLTFEFNRAFGSPQSNYYPAGKQFYKQPYFPINKDLPGGFVWFSPVPKEQDITSLQQTDMSYMYENRQTLIGAPGQAREHMVGEALGKPYQNNLKYGAINPWIGRFLGKGTGTDVIKYGDFKGNRYEWRFLGYNIYGNAIANPYFPDDAQSSDLASVTTRQQNDAYWASASFIPQGWDLPESIKEFGPEDKLNEKTRKIEWIQKYFLPDHPEFAKKGNASYWANYLRPLTDPSQETGVWLGWNRSGGLNWYNCFLSSPPKQSNLRLIDYKIYDSQNRLVARETRDPNNYYNVYSNFNTYQEYVHKGETYRIEVDVKNMTDVKQDIKNYPIELNHMYSFDEKIGDVSGHSTSKYKDTANSPYERNLPSGKVAHFTYTYTIPTDVKPREKIQFNAQIPSNYFTKGYNTIDADDTASIVMDIAPENLGVEFEGYYDMDKNPVDYVNAGKRIFRILGKT